MKLETAIKRLTAYVHPHPERCGAKDAWLEILRLALLGAEVEHQLKISNKLFTLEKIQQAADYRAKGMKQDG